MPEHVSHEREVAARGEVGHVRLGRHVVEPDVGADGEVGRVEGADDGERVGPRRVIRVDE